MCLTFKVGVRGLPERDIWSLRVGRGVAGKSMFLPPSPSPGLDPKKVVLVVNVFFIIGS